MDIRYNINRIHLLLSEKFQNVEIKEKSSLDFGKYFEICIKESKEVKVILPFKNIDGRSQIDWFYFANPLNENSELIQRNSTTESFTPIISDILEKNRFSEEYLKN
jgi:hypothetical protein